MVIAIANHKGGAGKTTTTINLGVALTKMNKRVLLVDLDPQGNLSYSFGIENDLCSYHLFTGENSFEEVVVQKEGLDILPSNMKLADVELSMQSIEDRVFVLKNMLDPLLLKYDFIILDCPPSRSLLTINALVISDYVISTVLLDVMSIQGLIHIENTVKEVRQAFNNKLEILGILAVNVAMRKNISKDVVEYINSNFEIHFFKSMIRSNVKIAEAPSHGMSVLNYAPKSIGALDYLELVKELLTVLKSRN